MNTENNSREDRKLSSEDLAALIVDELVETGFVKKSDFSEAVKVATLEIDIRKTAGDY